MRAALLLVALAPALALGGGAPDLLVRSLSNQPALSPAGTLEAEVAVRNAGRRKAGRFKLAFYLSIDRKLDRRDPRLGSRSIKSLRPRKVKRKSEELAVPARSSAGTYWLFACADARRKVSERNERNNCRRSRTRVTLGGPGRVPGPVPGPGAPPIGAPPHDTSPPNTEITAGPSGTVQSASATFEFRSTESGATFECRLDGGAFSTCASPRQLTGLSIDDHEFAVRARDSSGNVDPTPATRAWTVEERPPPGPGPTDPPAADPRGQASGIDQSVATSFGDVTSFLYTGSNPIQVGVGAGRIDADRVAVLRGQVKNRMGAGIGGVRITILGHPEWGRTATRIDGGFEMAVNGGGDLVVRYQRAGYIPLQRQVTVPWQDYVAVEDVVMVPYDDQVTEIDLSSAADIQTARGSAVTDADGIRRATLLFSQGTDAEMVMPNGATTPLQTLNVRATEYTIGESGPEAMPGELPASSGYTYAVELSVDEAVEAGATEVRFDKPVITYVENFLDFPVGGPVPTGYYDRARGVWVPSRNGTVIEVISETGGRADLDVDGDGAADGQAALGGLGITDAERERVASLYAPGQTLWRVPITHFTPWDCNWPYGPPPDAIPPDPPMPGDNRPKPKKKCFGEGSIIGCEGQDLGQAIAVAGAPFELNYWSNRTPGRRDERALEIPVSGPSVPASLAEIKLQMSVAGRVFERSFAPAPNIRHNFVWDGTDAYGRRPQGPQPVTISLGYRYGLVKYSSGVEAAAAFGRVTSTGSLLDESRSRMDFVLWRHYYDQVEAVLGGWDARGQGMGGWTLDGHHAYDPRTRTVYLGDGGTLSAEPAITTAGGTGEAPPVPGHGDGGPATAAQLGYANDVEVAPDGSIYIAEIPRPDEGRLRRIRPDGVIETVAGGGFTPSDGVPATQAELGSLRGISLAPDGGIYLAEVDKGRVRRIDPQGIIRTVAGGGSQAVVDGIPATQADLGLVAEVAAGPDGSLYIADGHRVRHVGLDGIITTVAGTGASGSTGDGGPAAAAKLEFVNGLAVSPVGDLYIGHRGRIRRVDTGGTITTVAGGGAVRGDGGPATEAQVEEPYGMDFGPDGGLYFAERSSGAFLGNYVRRLAPDGIITTAAGRPISGGAIPADLGDRGPATRAVLGEVVGVSVAPDGSRYIATHGDNPFSGRIRRVARPLARDQGGTGLIPSRDGSAVYEFDAAGRHLRTLEGLTGAVRREFGYDGAGRLVSITDGDGNVTTIERDGTGRPTAIVASGGQRTELDVNPDGWISRIGKPAGEDSSMAYTAGGLMTQLVDPRNGVHRFQYDGMGRLTRDEDPESGVQTLERTFFANGYTVRKTTALGRVTTFRVERVPTGGLRLERSNPSGAETTVVSRPDGSQVATYPDGTRVELQTGPDPRWGFAVPTLETLRHETPGGLTVNATYKRQAEPSDPGDPFSFPTLSDELELDGRATTRSYDRAARTLTTTSPEGRVTETTLDGDGRVARVVPGPGLDPIRFTRDSKGRLTRAEQGPQAWNYDYDARNRLVKVTDAAGKATEYDHDAADRLTRLTRPSGKVYGFGYDPAGKPTSVRMPDLDVHELGWNGVDQLDRFKPSGSAPDQNFAYDADHGLTDVALPSGSAIEHSRDPGARPTGQSYNEAETAFGYADDTRRVTSIERDPVGTGPVESLALSYDADLPKRFTQSGTAAGQFDFSYDSSLLLSNVTLTSGATTLGTAIARDDDGLVTTLGPFTLTRSGPGGAVTQYGDGTLDLDYGYDGQAQLATRNLKVGTAQPFRAEITRDDSGLITRKVETVGGTESQLDYFYDDDGRLVRVERGGAAVEAYFYDSNGNRTSRRGGAGPVEAYTYDAQERVASRGSVVYGFDADGFLASRGTDSFDYSARGELLQATVGGQTVTYAYDGLGRRVSRTVGSDTTQYLYGNPGDPFQVSAVRAPSGELTTYSYDEGGHLFAMQRGGSRHYIGSDQIGTVRIVVDSSGSVVKSLSYDTFGNLVSDSAPGFEMPFGFAGGLADSATGLVRFGFRDYEPATGRWTARDPVLFRGGQANLYEYVGSNPVDRRDPSGLFCVGGSVYTGYGAGGQVCITDEGVSACAEVGFGFGKDLSLETGDLAEDGESIVAEAEASFGPATGNLGVELDDTGCLSFGPPQLELTEFVKVKIDNNGPNVGIEPEIEIEDARDALAETTRAGVQAKVAARVCRKFGG